MPGVDGGRRTRHAVSRRPRGAIIRTQTVQQRSRAGNGTRTRDPNLGKVVLYQLSYSRTRPLRGTTGVVSVPEPVTLGGDSRIGRARQVSHRARDGGEGNRTPDLLNAIQALSQLSYAPGRSLRPRSLEIEQQSQELQNLAGGISGVKRRALAETPWVSILQRPEGGVRNSGVAALITRPIARLASGAWRARMSLALCAAPGVSVPHRRPARSRSIALGRAWPRRTTQHAVDVAAPAPREG
jgi:hypothetical protein